MEERDFSAEELKNGEKIAEEKTEYVVKELGENPEFSSTTTTYFDSEGTPVTARSITQYKADCGHWVTKPEDMKGKCSCGANLCAKCSTTACINCRSQPLCPSCSRVGRVAQEVAGPDGQVLKVAEMVLCPHCYRLLLAGRLIRSVFGGIHRFLSREISDDK